MIKHNCANLHRRQQVLKVNILAPPLPSPDSCGLAERPQAPRAGHAVIGRERRGPLRTYSFMLRVNAALAPSQQRGTTFVLDALVNGDGLAAQAAKRSAETAYHNAEPCSSCHTAHCRRHFSAGAPPTSAEEYACASVTRTAGSAPAQRYQNVGSGWGGMLVRFGGRLVSSTLWAALEGHQENNGSGLQSLCPPGYTKDALSSCCLHFYSFLSLQKMSR